ncbi:hypothetical protein SKAU_G00219460 [Synaphobranchus kaupii]|uniref:Uncharacterized protein n=1 Tax=Synaphobranchus kaupii TaxID=118154 RepID=A0A9Q1IVD0_SYNKA|nr:hypothetical protein SKAU_G00219460 [Synaphobranchus kaupii]
MVYTFKSDDCMVITIPLSSTNKGKEGQLLPENFHCVFKDAYKVFLKGNPKALGTAQLITGLLIISLGLLNLKNFAYTMPSVLFIISGMLSYAAGHSPNMCMAHSETEKGIQGMAALLIALEMSFAVILIYWESKAVCREHFNILPVVNLKLEA